MSFPSVTGISSLKPLVLEYDFTTLVAVSGKYVFSWNAKLKLVYKYKMTGELAATYRLNLGSYGPSISYANNMLWVAADNEGESNTWYGYLIPKY